jgi:hypothetical protein
MPTLVERSRSWPPPVRRFIHRLGLVFAVPLVFVAALWVFGFALAYPIAYIAITGSGLAAAALTLTIAGHSYRQALHERLSADADAQHLFWKRGLDNLAVYGRFPV